MLAAPSLIQSERLRLLVALSVSLDLPGGVHYPLLTGKEGVALAAQFYLQYLFRRACRPGIAAGADNLGVFIVFRMNLSFHSLVFNDTDLLSCLGGGGKLNRTGAQGEEGVVLTDTDVVPGVDLRPPLADDNHPGGHGLPVMDFNSQALRLAVAAVPAGAAGLLMSQVKSPLSALLFAR